jgi:hypothetical protein
MKRAVFSIASQWAGMIMFLLLLPGMGLAQHQEIHEMPNLWRGRQIEEHDSTSLLAAFRDGRASGHFRSYWMNTDNRLSLSDYYALAVGGGLRYETAPFYGFQFAVSGFYIFDVVSSDFTKTDPITGAISRYELALFDLTNPKNHHDLDRLEELYLKYRYRWVQIRLGKQLLNTPFVNLQDGRMRPTGVNGLWMQVDNGKRWKIEGGLIHKVSPRSTVHWYNIGKSIGLYPTGVDVHGNKSGYAGHLNSRVMSLAGLECKPLSSLTLRAWHHWVQGIYHASLMEAHYHHSVDEHREWYSGIQSIGQFSDGGGHEESTKQYMPADARSYTAGFQSGIRSERWDISVNYNRIFGPDRYLQPREWGREPFFTFMPRERNEGMGDAEAIVLKGDYRLRGNGFHPGLAVGYFRLPDIADAHLNKYGLPSYVHVNLDLRYHFHGFFEGLDAQLLLVGKWNATGEAIPDANAINKVDMWMANAIMNYHF